MKKFFRSLFAGFPIILLLWAFPMQASANAAEPPCFTVVVNNAPKELKLSVEYADGNDCELLELGPQDSRVWERYYRFFLIHNEASELNLQKMRLRVEFESTSFTCAFPQECTRLYNGLIILNLKQRTLSTKASALRTFLLVSLRILLTLLIEGLVFFLFGYRKKGSWLLFVLTNLVTQLGLNFLILVGASSADPSSHSFLIFFLLVSEVLIFLTELLVFTIRLRERSKGRAALCALAANTASLLLGSLCLMYLPC